MKLTACLISYLITKALTNIIILYIYGRYACAEHMINCLIKIRLYVIHVKIISFLILKY